METDRDLRIACTKSYGSYRYRLDKHGPNHEKPISEKAAFSGSYWPPVDANEWDLYLKPGTMFDNAVKTVLDRKEGWMIDFVGHRSDWKSLERIEIKRSKDHISITLWSCAGSARLFI